MWLKYTEEEIWNLTPRQFMAQVDVHEAVTKAMYGVTDNRSTATPIQPMGFIDQIKGW